MNLEERIERIEAVLKNHVGTERFNSFGAGEELHQSLEDYIKYWLSNGKICKNGMPYDAYDKLDKCGFNMSERKGISRDDLFIVLNRISKEGLVLK